MHGTSNSPGLELRIKVLRQQTAPSGSKLDRPACSAGAAIVRRDTDLLADRMAPQPRKQARQFSVTRFRHGWPSRSILIGWLYTGKAISLSEDLGSEASIAIQEMLTWLESGGAQWSRDLKIREVTPGERGLVSLENRRAWERDLLQVPVGRMFSANECLKNESSFVSRLSPRLRGRLAQSHALLHVCFLEHRLLLGTTSPYAPYIRTLPSSLTHLPLLASASMLDLLQGSQVHADVTRHRSDLENLYGDLGWELADFQHLVTFEDFLLTYCMVESHSHARHEGNDTMPLMVPLVDLVNHRSDGSEQLRLGWTDAGGHLSVHVGRPGAVAGQQLFFKYSDEGELSQKFFKQFGFVDGNLPIGAKVAFPLQRHHPHYAEKRLLFEESLVRAKTMIERIEGLDAEKYIGADSKIHDFPKFVIWPCSPAKQNFTPQRPSMVEQELLPFGRFVTMRGGAEKVHRLCNVTQKPPACLRGMSPQDDAAALEYLVGVVKEHIGRYRDSVDVDEELLASLGNHSPEEPYIRIRRDEKRCLSRLLEALDEFHEQALAAAGQMPSAPTPVPLQELPANQTEFAMAAQTRPKSAYDETSLYVFAIAMLGMATGALAHVCIRRFKATRYRE